MAADIFLEQWLSGRGDALPLDSQPLAESLALLDDALEVAIAGVEGAFKRNPATSAFRGLYVPPGDAAQLFAQAPGRGPWAMPDRAPGEPRFLGGDGTSRLATLRRRFGLDAFESDALLVAASPDLDQRYERLFGLLQDDVTRRRPTLATIAQLAAPRSIPQWQGVGLMFSGRCSLLRSGLVRVVADPAHALTALGAHYLLADPQVIHFLAGYDSLELALQACCELRAPAPADGFAAVWRRHPELAAATQLPAVLRLAGATAWERMHLAHALASRQGMGLLALRLDAADARTSQAGQELERARLAARLQDAVLFIEEGSGDPRAVRIAAACAAAGGRCLLSSASAADGGGLDTCDVRLPSAGERLLRWQRHLQAAGRRAAPRDLEDVAREFQLDGEQTDRAAADACATPGEATLGRARLFGAARRPLALRLPPTLQAIEPRARWADLILTEDTSSHLREICVHARERSRVLDEWGFGTVSARGQGVNVLFSGSSGTGKSTACEALSSELGRTLLRIDLSQTVSKYLGESEKHLAEVFDVAEQCGAILMFDEADALFGKRTGVSDAHDRYANLEVSYLLQRIEAFRGILVLTTNMQANIDTAFLRRLQFIVEFAFPDAGQRERIWRLNVPAAAPRDADLDLGTLAQRYAVAGGSIRNIALAAAMLAAGNGEAIGMRHMALGARREYQKLGKALPDGDYFSNGTPR